MNKKILIAFLCTIIISLVFILPVFADSPPGKGTMQSAMQNPWSGNSGVSSAGSKILGIIQLVGNAFSIGILIIIGVRFVSAAPSEKAEIKKNMVPYLIGATLVFASVNVVSMMSEMAGWFT